MVSLSLAVAAAVLGSIVAVRLVDRGDRRWGDALRARFVMGVPWGTLVVTAFVLAVYLIVQDGLADFSDPVVLPFRAWSYLYPLGIATAPFAHAGADHLVGNLTGALVVAPVAEYAWGHYPHGRGAESFASVRSNPWVRALVLFPLAAVGVGLATGIFAVGPVIGFSGVVYAFAGFALVRFPFTTLVAFIGAGGAASTLYQALRRPIVQVTAQPSPPSPPWWAEIAIQGHGLGILLGVLAGVAVFRRRAFDPDPLRIWIAALLYGFAQSLWAIYWFRGDNTYVLFRGPGVIVVTVLALVVTLAVVASDRPLVPAPIRRRIASAFAGSAPDRVRERTGRILELAFGSAAAGSGTSSRIASGGRVRDIVAGVRSRGVALETPTRSGTAVMIVAVVLAAISGPAIPVNLFTADDTATPDEAVSIADYEIYYAEDVENELVSVIDAEFLGEDTSVETSGVIVSSAERHIWTDAVTTARLAFSGEETILVGGPGWRGSVTAERAGWSAAGADTAYQVWLDPEDGDRRHVFASDSVRADVRVAGNNVSVVPEGGAFYLEVSDGSNATRVELPRADGPVEANGVTFVREGAAVYATTDDTRVRVASREEYE